MKTNLISAYSAAFVLCLMLTVGCKSQQFTSENLPEKQLVFGDGGGVTGAVTEYILLENGQLFKHYSLDQGTKELGHIRKNAAKKLFEKASDLHLEKMDVNKPGNMYYFVQYRDSSNVARCTWGAPTYQVDEQLQNLHSELMSKTKEVIAPKK